MGRERSAFHPGPEFFAPTKAVYICADQPVIHFSLATRRRTIHSVWPVIVAASPDLGRRGLLGRAPRRASASSTEPIPTAGNFGSDCPSGIGSATVFQYL